MEQELERLIAEFGRAAKAAGIAGIKEARGTFDTIKRALKLVVLWLAIRIAVRFWEGFDGSLGWIVILLWFVPASMFFWAFFRLERILIVGETFASLKGLAARLRTGIRIFRRWFAVISFIGLVVGFLPLWQDRKLIPTLLLAVGLVILLINNNWMRTVAVTTIVIGIAILLLGGRNGAVAKRVEPWTKLDKFAKLIPKDREKPLALVCRENQNVEWNYPVRTTDTAFTLGVTYGHLDNREQGFCFGPTIVIDDTWTSWALEPSPGTSYSFWPDEPGAEPSSFYGAEDKPKFAIHGRRFHLCVMNGSVTVRCMGKKR